MNNEIIPTERENITEDTNLTTVKSFDELLGCDCTTYDDGTLNIKDVLLDFKVDGGFFAKIKEANPEIKQLCFDYCTFSRKIVVEGAIIEYLLDFTYTTFKGEVDFTCTTFKGEPYFDNVTFEGKIDFTSAIFEDNAYFYNTIFEGEVDFTGVTFKGEIYFTGAIFKGDVDFTGAIFESEPCFSEVTFEGNAHFGITKFEDGAYFGYTTFEGNARFGYAKFVGEAYFSKATFKGKVDFTCTPFEGKVDFSGATFVGEVDFSHVHFYLKITMEELYAYSKMSFTSTEFDNGINFCDCNFNGTILFEKILLSIEKENNNNELSFDSCSFSSDSIVKVQNIDNNNNIIIKNTTIRGSVIMRNVKVNSFSLKDSIVTGTISLADNVDFKETEGRYTDCILKHTALKINDNVNFLKYRKREHIKILINWFVKKEFKPYRLFKKVRNYWNGFMEFWVVFLNLISNNFGQSWIIGVFFTIGVAMLSVAILQDIAIASNFTCDYFPTFWKNSLNFVWLPNILSKEPNSLADTSMTIFVLGKILVGFGIYQTITAFKRHGK